MVAAGATKELVAVGGSVVGSTYTYTISRARPGFYAVVVVSLVPASRLRLYVLRLFLYAFLGRARSGIELLSREETPGFSFKSCSDQAPACCE